VIEMELHASHLLLQGKLVVVGCAELSLKTHNALLREGHLSPLGRLDYLRLSAQPLLLQQQRAHVHYLRL
jgi:hypothetical protein